MKEKKKRNPLLWFIFAVMIPLLITVALTVLILMFSGVDIGGWAKKIGSKIPIVSSLIQEDEKSQESSAEERSQKDEEIKLLKNQVVDLEKQNNDLKQTNAKMKNENESNNNLNLDSEEIEDEQEEETSTTVKEIANSFKQMKPKQAALIMEDLSNEQANEILKELSNNTRGKILQEMDPNKAGNLVENYMNDSN